MSSFRPFLQPIGTSACDFFDVKIDGLGVFVYPMRVASHVSYHAKEAIEITVTVPIQITEDQVSISPKRLGIIAEVNAHAATIKLEKPQNLSIEIAGRTLYLFYINDREPATSDVIRFKSGQVYHPGVIEIGSNQTLWIEPGAIVHGLIRAYDAENVHVGGGGTLVANVRHPLGSGRAVVFDNCRGVHWDDVSIIDPLSWMLTVNGCEQVAINNLHEIGEIISSDGIDVAGSRHVRIKGGMLRNNDDCLVIKSLNLSDHDKSVRTSGAQPVYDVVAEGVICANDRAGNGLEIGHELQTAEIHDITFRDIDILHCHGHGAPFSVNSGDRAVIHNVFFDVIRVEHFYDKLVSLRVMKSRDNVDEERGAIRNITFRNVKVDESPFNAGYSTSIIGGWDEAHLVEDIHFENFTIGGKKLTQNDDWDVYMRHAKDIHYR